LGGLRRNGDEEAKLNEGNRDEEEQGAMFGGWLPEEVAVRVFRWLAPDDLARAELVASGTAS
jgi:hypothetical protein